MELPIELRSAIEEEISGIKPKELLENAKSISSKYRNESGMGKRLVTDYSEAFAYSVVRMPATFGAVYKALSYTLDLIDFNIESLIDVGTGTGAAVWACDSLIDLKTITCLEREEAMRNVGKRIMEKGSKALVSAKWIKYDLIKDNINEKADLVTASYILNELSEEERLKAVDKLWNASKKVLLIIEPGTVKGYDNLRKIREYLINKGAHLIAPCPHENKCTLEEGNWCHFSCRIPRSKLHRQLKEGEVPYEDEKFSYLAFSHNKCNNAYMRILRHPIIEKGRISLNVCSKDEIKDIKLFKKKDKELYKQARKAKWGDELYNN